MKAHILNSINETTRAMGNAALPYVKVSAEIFAEALWPTRCASCDRPGATLCEACEQQLPYIDWNQACPLCGAPFGMQQCCECNTTMLNAASREKLPYARAVSAISYDEEAKRIVSAFKDKGERRLAYDMARIMTRYIPPEWLDESPLVTFVPASTAAFRKRGYDHAQLLSKEVANMAALDHASLYARPRSFDQRQLDRTKRLANMQKRIQLLPAASTPPSIIIVDDVCTTGATLFAACDALENTGVKHIYCLTFARV